MSIFLTDYREDQNESVTANPDYSIDVEFYVLELSAVSRGIISYDIEVMYHGETDSYNSSVNVTDSDYQVN